MSCRQVSEFTGRADDLLEGELMQTRLEDGVARR